MDEDRHCSARRGLIFRRLAANRIASNTSTFNNACHKKAP
ncbi:hypothetical protein HMPREF9080_01922 [Cardiobacterium valvarum F0432]|uniref:Uncharacterized protein n=1 Tax=Cardiobacterium valvarum F0432 TaxID=797473 RepID=G9ZGL7_9GAMM|nr:hypothetical protein HMPREF9080_01922 [Cardiobacterium valvarum F0432]